MSAAPLNRHYHALRAPMLLSSALVGLGCAAGQKPAPTTAPTPPLAGSQSEPDLNPEAAGGGKVDAVARAAEAYAASVKRAMAARAATPAAARIDAPESVAAEDPKSWVKPADLSLAPGRPQDPPRSLAPSTKPVAIVAVPPPNSPVSAGDPDAATPARLSVIDPDEPAQGSDRGDSMIASVRPGTRAAPFDNAPIAPPVAPVVEPLEARLLKAARAQPSDLANQLDYQLVLLAAGKPSPDLAAAALLPSDDRSLLLAVLDGLGNFKAANRSGQSPLPRDKVRPLTEMADRLSSAVDLNVPTAVLCSKVDSFGRYEPIDPAAFKVAAEHPVVLYCEVDHFASKLDAQGQWRTRLTWDAALFDESGKKVWTGKTTEVDDLSRNRRRDFFAAKVIRLPATLGVGRYLLKATMVDRQAERVAEKTIPLQIVP